MSETPPDPSITVRVLLAVATCLYCLCFDESPSPATHNLTHHPSGEVLTVCGPCAQDPQVHELFEQIVADAAKPFRLTR